MEQIMYGYYYHSISDLYILGIILIIFGVANLLGHGRTPGTYKSYYYVLRYRRRNGLIRLISGLSLIHISEPTRRTPISYAVFCLKKKKKPERHP